MRYYNENTVYYSRLTASYAALGRDSTSYALAPASPSTSSTIPPTTLIIKWAYSAPIILVRGLTISPDARLVSDNPSSPSHL